MLVAPREGLVPTLDALNAMLDREVKTVQGDVYTCSIAEFSRKLIASAIFCTHHHSQGALQPVEADSDDEDGVIGTTKNEVYST